MSVRATRVGQGLGVWVPGVLSSDGPVVVLQRRPRRVLVLVGQRSLLVVVWLWWLVGLWLMIV